MKVYPYRPDVDDAEWDKLILNSNNGVFLHTRRFLAYHRNKFIDQSLLFRNDEGKLLAVLPAAQEPDFPARVASHPGITYGGFLYHGRIELDAVEELFALAVKEYRCRGATELIYKCIPIHLQAHPAQLDEYFLWRNKAMLVRRDLWNTIDLIGGRTLSKGRKWGIEKAKKANLTVKKVTGDDDYSAFHRVLDDCLDTRHHAHPVHTCEEMRRLRNMFPEKIELWVATGASANVLAGVWIFKFGKSAWHTQYIASTAEGRTCQAVDLLIESVLKCAEADGAHFFSFGASTEQQGKVYNAGLYNFKSGFGFGAITQDTYSIDIVAKEYHDDFSL
jgi:hypothetical protein